MFYKHATGMYTGYAKNGQPLKIHSITLTCTKQYQQGQRLLTRKCTRSSNLLVCIVTFHL